MITKSPVVRSINVHVFEWRSVGNCTELTHTDLYKSLKVLQAGKVGRKTKQQIYSKLYFGKRFKTELHIFDVVSKTHIGVFLCERTNGVLHS